MSVFRTKKRRLGLRTKRTAHLESHARGVGERSACKCSAPYSFHETALVSRGAATVRHGHGSHVDLGNTLGSWTRVGSVIPHLHQLLATTVLEVVATAGHVTLLRAVERVKDWLLQCASTVALVCIFETSVEVAFCVAVARASLNGHVVHAAVIRRT